ncbi:alpha/beta-hydrolase [Patellaria atrata CBS 101060]|uniref:Alpha/beta-hydrolase n=1 Tax=Patellaria atrata CBS 101060 TaxID=1346257 RepID=A0A9P4VUC6_9PEZI|nr:alpha/beta-hydrolase [Patellaria atrata CBS 101060]
MVALSPIIKKAYWTLAGVGAVYIIFLSALSNTWIQRHALYAHKLFSGWWVNYARPEAFGFASKQVTPFNVSTPDGEILSAWHVLSLDTYGQNEQEILESKSSPIDEDEEFSSIASNLRFLSDDPRARLVIDLHGNAGHVAQGWRTASYLSLTALPKTHVLALDYRGYGHSTGSPTEAGLITDGIALVNYAIDTLHVPASRIILLGQSLGTAVVSAVALSFADPDNSTGLIPTGVEKGVMNLEGTDFASVILIAPFTSMPDLMGSYRIAGIIPILSSLRPYPRIQSFFRRMIVDTWETESRLKALVSLVSHKHKGIAYHASFDGEEDYEAMVQLDIAHNKSSRPKLNLKLIHARNDYNISPRNSGQLLRITANATSFEGLSNFQFESRKEVIKKGDGTLERFVADGVRIEFELLPYGGHNRIVSFADVAICVNKGFQGL